MTTTTSLDYPALKLARLEDPSTSLESAGDPTRVRVTHRRRVLAVFAAEPDGLDYHAAAELSGLERHEAQRRISDLERLGLLDVKRDEDGTEVRTVLVSGRPGRVHVITPEGLEALR